MKLDRKKNYTITVFCENNVGVLSRIAGIFSRRKINILSLNINSYEEYTISKMSILVYENYDIIKKINLQIKKQIDIINSYHHNDKDIIWKEIGLFKISIDIIMNKIKIDDLLYKFNGHLIFINNKFAVIEVIGKNKEINKAKKYFSNFGIIEFTKSGRIPVFIKNENIDFK